MSSYEIDHEDAYQGKQIKYTVKSKRSKENNQNKTSKLQFTYHKQFLDFKRYADRTVSYTILSKCRPEYKCVNFISVHQNEKNTRFTDYKSIYTNYNLKIICYLKQYNLTFNKNYYYYHLE